MGAGTIIATAIAITLLIITGYVLIGGTLSTARAVALAQQAATDREAEKLHTRIEVINASTIINDNRTYIEVKNTGSTIIRDFDHMEVYLLQGVTLVPFTTVPGNLTIAPDGMNPTLLDPDEVANITVGYDQALGDPTWVKVTTANGVYASKYTDMI